MIVKRIRFRSSGIFPMLPIPPTTMWAPSSALLRRCRRRCRLLVLVTDDRLRLGDHEELDLAAGRLDLLLRLFAEAFGFHRHLGLELAVAEDLHGARGGVDQPGGLEGRGVD